MSKRSLHVHVHRATRDMKWTGRLTARTKRGVQVSFTATVEAPDSYVAGDKLKELAREKYGDDLLYPVIKFENPSRLAAGSLSQRIASRAGPEEE